MELRAENRILSGSANASLRAQGLIPAELYGKGVQNEHLAVPMREFAKVFREAGEHALVNLGVGAKKIPVLIHEVQRDYLNGDFLHVDFYQVRMDEMLTVRIPIEFFGEASAVKEKGGILNKVVSEIEIEVLPAHMPSSFRVDLGVLDDLNKSIHVKDISAGKEVKVLFDADMVIATVTAPQEEKAEEAQSVAEVKVETEEKKAERAAEKTKGSEEA